MIDTAEIIIKAGNGGNGYVSFRRTKHVPRGGPDGGDGGNGGNIVIRTSPTLNTLSNFHRKKVYTAQNGQDGMKERKKGQDGKDLIIHIPKGTIIRNEKGEILFDLTKDNQETLIAEGGQGGLGNWHFKSSTNQTPRKATQGIQGKEKTLKMELKIIADVGIIGLPNSGKSTLLNNLTRASAKIGTYQFTTLEPNLGVMFTKGKEITLADIPGLIENASKGKGLGHDFLRHIERTKILIHLIDGIEALSTNGINKLIQNYKIIQSELQSWNKKILNKPQIVVINKIDITEVIDKRHTILSKFQQINIKPFFISAITSKGVDEIIEEIIKMLDKHQKAEKKNNKEEVLNTKIYKIDDLPNKRIIFKS